MADNGLLISMDRPICRDRYRCQAFTQCRRSRAVSIKDGCRIHMDTTTSQMRLGRLLIELRSLGAKERPKFWLTPPTERTCSFNRGDVTVLPEWWKHNKRPVYEKLQRISREVGQEYEDDKVISFTMDNIDVQTSMDQRTVVNELMKYSKISHLSLHNIGMGDECTGYLMHNLVENRWENLQTLDISDNKITDTMKTKLQAEWNEHVKYMYHGSEFDGERSRCELILNHHR